MGLFSGIGKFFKKIFTAIAGFFKKFLASLGAFLPLLIIAAFIFAPYLGPWLTEMGLGTLGGMFTALGGFTTTLGTYGTLALGLGVSYLVAPEGTQKLISSVVEVAGSLAKGVVSVATTGVTSLLTSTPVLLIGGCVLAYFLFTNGSTGASHDS